MLKDVLLEFVPTEKRRECPDNKGIYGLVTHFVHAMPLFIHSLQPFLTCLQDVLSYFLWVLFWKKQDKQFFFIDFFCQVSWCRSAFYDQTSVFTFMVVNNTWCIFIFCMCACDGGGGRNRLLDKVQVLFSMHFLFCYFNPLYNSHHYGLVSPRW